MLKRKYMMIGFLTLCLIATFFIGVTTCTNEYDPDINDDGTVDMLDVGIACAAYGSWPEHPRWNPDADLNNDDVVDMRDLGIICDHYGEEV